jgi:hypothetical protein
MPLFDIFGIEAKWNLRFWYNLVCRNTITKKIVLPLWLFLIHTELINFVNTSNDIQRKKIERFLVLFSGCNFESLFVQSWFHLLPKLLRFQILFYLRFYWIIRFRNRFWLRWWFFLYRKNLRCNNGRPIELLIICLHIFNRE